VELQRILSAMKREGLSLASAAPVLLQAKEEVVGLMITASRVPWQFSEAELQLLTSIGQQIAVAIENARLYEAAQRELTERKRAEEALRESEQRFRDVARTTGDWIWEVDAEGRYTYASPVVEQVLGYTPEDVLGRHYYDFFHPDEQEELKTLAQETFQRKEPFVQFLNPNVHQDGRTVILETTGLPLTDGEGNLLGYRGADRDVTARVWSEETLHALNAAAAAIQRAARTPEAVFTAIMEQLQALGLTGAVVLLDERREQFIIRYPVVASEALAQAEKLIGFKAVGYTFPVEQLPFGRQVLAGEAVFVPDVAALLAPVVPALVRPLMPTAMRLLEMPRGVVAPLSVAGKIISFLGVSGDRLTKADMPAVTAFANQMAAALENARLFEAAQRRAAQLEAIGEAGRQITSLLELDPLLDRIVNLIHEAFSYRYVNVLLVDPARGELALRAGAGYEVETAKALRLRVGEEGICGWVAASGEPLLVDDVSQEPRYYPVEVLADTRSELAVPIWLKDQVIGVLDVQSAELGAFDEEDLFALQTLADQVSVAIENARLYEETRKHTQELRRRAERLALLNSISTTISSGLELDRILQAAVKGLATIFEVDRWGVVLFDQQLRYARLVAQRPTGDGAGEEMTFPLESGEFLEQIMAVRQPVAIRDVRELPLPARIGEALARRGIKSMLIAALTVKEEVAGLVLLSATGEPREFTSAEVELAQTIANQVSIAIENARLYLAQKEEAEISETLLRVAATISSLTDLDELLKTTLKLTVELLKADRSIIWLWDEGQEVFFPREVHGFSGPMSPGLKDLELSPKEVPILGELLRRKAPVAVDDALRTTLIPQPLVKAFEIKSILGVPVIYQEQLLGALGVSHVREARCFTEKEIALATGIANQAAIAIENARLFEVAQQELAERKRAEEELQHTLERLRKAMGGIIQAMALAVEMKDAYTAGHQRRVADLARAIATEMGLSEEQIDGIRMAGVIHDIGKITVPAEILSKPVALSDLEYGLIKVHSQVGYDILKEIEFPWPVAEMVLQHHERMDGSGYPQGLSGDEIMLEARILAVADVVEAMASYRPYRPPRGMDKALEEISQNGGVLYDSEVVDACLRLFTEKGFKLE